MLNSESPKALTLYRVDILGQSLRLNQYHMGILAVLSCLVLYLVMRHPPTVSIAVSAGVTVVWAWALPRSSGLDVIWDRLFPTSRAFSRRRKKLSEWYWLSMALLAFAVFGQVHPASAQFFNALEKATTQVVTQSNSGIDPTIIKVIFILFRVLVVLAFVAGVVGLLVQAFRGGDWQPIASMIGIGVAFVIGVEVITTLMIGNGAGTAGGGGTGAGGP